MMEVFIVYTQLIVGWYCEIQFIESPQQITKEDKLILNSLLSK